MFMEYLYDMEIKMNWGALGIGAVIAFLLGWLIFGLLGAIIGAIIVLLLTGILSLK
jgi:high-affinity Fe2+/Pb2+ permease